MASQKTKHAETTISEEQKKALMCVIHFQGSASKSFVLSGCQRPENRLKNLQDMCKWNPMKPADSPNQMEDS